MPLPSFTVTGNLFEITGAISASDLVQFAPTTLRFTFTPNLPNISDLVTYNSSLYQVDIVYGGVNSDGAIKAASMVDGVPVTTSESVKLLANDTLLNIRGLQWKVQLEVRTGNGNVWRELTSWWIAAPNDGDTVNLATESPVIQVGPDAVLVQGVTHAELKDVLAFNVKDYGAVGDGTTDDTDGLQSALNAAAATGGGVFMPAGTYKITDTLTIGDNTALYGTGRTSILKPVFASTSINRVIDNDWTTGSENITLRDFKIDRTGANVRHAILFNGVADLLIDGITVAGDPPGAYPTNLGGCIGVSSIGPLDAAVAYILSTNVRIVNCSLYDCWNYGVQVGHVDGCVIANNTAYDAYREVFGVEPETGCTAKNVVISGNTVVGSPNQAGSVTGMIIATEGAGGTVTGVTITGNVVRQLSTSGTDNPGIAVFGGTAVNVSGNTVHGVDGAGISIGSLSTATNGVVVSGNTVSDCGKNSGYAGIRLRQATRCTVVGNYVYGTSHSYSVEESGSAANNVIAWNYLRDTTPLSTPGSGTVVFGNKTADGNADVALGTSSTPAAPTFAIDAATGLARTISFKTAGAARWNMSVTGSESTGDAGSDLYIAARHDDGSANGDAVTIKRADRRFIFGAGYSVNRVSKATTYAADSTNCLIGVTSTAAARTITLPSAANVGAGAVVIVKDESGGAATNNITIAGTGGQTVNGAASTAIVTNYGAATLYCDGSNWFTMSRGIENTLYSGGPLGTPSSGTLTNCTGLPASGIDGGGEAKIATGGIISLHNQSDQTTNYERGRLYWSSNTLTLATDKGGTGTLRNIKMTAFGSLYALGAQSTSGIFQLDANTASLASVVMTNIYGTTSASSGTAVALKVSPTISQSSTAGYTALLVNPTESATGSGTKLLADFQVGGTSKHTVDNSGKITVSGTAATISSGTGSPESAVTAPVGSLYLRTDGGAATSIYVKESGSGNTGWVAK